MTDWEIGERELVDTARRILSDIREVESQLEPLTKEREKYRNELSEIVAHTGTLTLDGLGKISITAASEVKGYDKAALDDYIIELIDSHPDIAKKLKSFKTTSMRSGSLRIEQEKKK